jgi:hypothetical protein
MQLQFRYSKEIVLPTIWEEPQKYVNMDAIICSVDLTVLDAVCPITPVRFARIDKIMKHGSTLSVIFTIGNLAYSETPAVFTKEIDGKSGSQLPRKSSATAATAAAGSSGLFFLKVEDPGTLIKETTVAIWEQLVTQLYALPGYKDEQIFWTILGVHKGGVASLEVLNEFKRWSATIEGHNNPRTPRWRSPGKVPLAAARR